MNLFKRNSLRLIVLISFVVIINGYFIESTGILKMIPFPVLNCYSVPGAQFACPAGTFQHFLVLGFVSFFTLGIIFIVGAFLGRWTCGWACPFGMVQDLMFWIPLKKLKEKAYFKYLSYLKYVFLILMILLPLVWLNPDIMMGETYFCKICPAGSLGAGIPQVIMKPDLQNLLGFLYWAKIVMLIIFLYLFMIIKRPFCRFVCPVGAALSGFNKFSFLQIKVDQSKCNQCNLCQRVCPTNIKIYENETSADCIRCMNCTTLNCKAVEMTTILKEK